MHPVAIVATNASNVAVSARPIHPALALEPVSQISFIGLRLLESLRPSSPDGPIDQRAAVGSWFGNQDITQFFPPTSSAGCAMGNQLAAVSPAVPAGGRVKLSAVSVTR
jgi:hypothetical protein